jgi:hypothetical protein
MINPLVGTGGGGTFITGGLLKLDTVLNAGLPTESQSDVLVVDDRQRSLI